MKNTPDVDSVSLHLALNLAMVGSAMLAPPAGHPAHESNRTLREVMVLLADADTDTAFELALQAIERIGMTAANRDPGVFVLAGIVALLK